MVPEVNVDQRIKGNGILTPNKSNKVDLRMFIIFILLFSLFSGSTYAQYFKTDQLEQTVRLSIEKAYRASVIIWKYDTLSHKRTGGQFSGVVVTAEGHLLTAAHASVPGDTYQVVFPDGRSGIARGLGEITLAEKPGSPDVAMMKLLGKGKWPFAEMGWSHSLLKNEPCISIAYPETLAQDLPLIRFGYIYDLHSGNGFLQSTCLMEPGDSGGPLFDCFGRVIGLHSAIDISENENYEIPVDLYRKYWTALNKAETYRTYPATEDPVGTDPMASAKRILAAPADLEAGFLLNKNNRESSVLVRSIIKGEPQQIRGTLFSLQGKNNSVVVTKSTMVGNSPAIEISGHQFRLRVLARDKENDLVLLQAEDLLKGGIPLKEIKEDTIAFSNLGKFLITPLGKSESRISILGSMQIKIPKMMSIGYTGIHVAYNGPLIINSIQAGTPAIDAGLQEGDELLGINGVHLKNRADYVRESIKCWSGDTISLTVQRKGMGYEKRVILTDQPETVAANRMARFVGARSIRRDGFDNVFAHDARLKPADCGGPVFDSSDHFYGINIARFSRTSSLVMPAATVAAFLHKEAAKI